MKKLLLGLVALIFIASPPLLAETDIDGSLKVDLRSFVKKPYCDFFNREDILKLKISSNINDNVSFYASVEGRYYDSPEVENFSDLSDRNKVDPLTMDIWQAYISISSFILENMDAVIGKQIVSWGTADTLNPTNTLNPHDLSDPLDFSKKIPITMFNFTYYPPWDQFNAVQIIWIPSHKPALLPPFQMPFSMNFPEPSDLKDQNLSMGDQNNPLANKMKINQTMNQFIDHNPFYPKYSEFGIRLSFNFFQTDFHLSYFNGYDELPKPREIHAVITNTDEITDKLKAFMNGETVDSIPVDVEENVTLAFPRYHIVGADFKGDLNGIGIWGEAGFYIPYQYDITYIYPDTKWIQQNEMNYFIKNQEFGVRYKTVKLTYLDKPYLKYTLGADYVFPGGYHVEAQFARGFFFEEGNTGLNDYLMLEFDKSFMDDTFKLTIAGGGNVQGGTLIYLLKHSKLPDNISTGAFGGPKLEYYPYDGLTLTVGAIFMGGGGDSFFAKMRDMAQVYLQAESTF